ncbi:hypothetical protein HYH03_010334 [Edaphochlamys debaryana]|uniref:Uncharacterized protein n=1 Tax=Edaphochlamys debaryana TaxID=47281 RepID=A0A835Y5B4_9CHLO|nr:hypothetical protein HYH03_010334 [Edaphochlamys debaryana]|eukprot:KAG2491329.1 hypothetical protein HYH03_010334 [Edaphochlamys debaryana]
MLAREDMVNRTPPSPERASADVGQPSAVRSLAPARVLGTGSCTHAQGQVPAPSPGMQQEAALGMEGASPRGYLEPLEVEG